MEPDQLTDQLMSMFATDAATGLHKRDDVRKLVEGAFAEKQFRFVPEGGGQLSLLLFWQSLDGRPAFRDYDTLIEAKKHVEHLGDLGRSPALYIRLQI